MNTKFASKLTAASAETDSHDFTVYVYSSGSAMLEFPYTREDESNDCFMTEADLRDLAAAAIWAADLLAEKALCA